MLWLAVLLLTVIWIGVVRFQNRRIIRFAKQIKCDLKSYPIIGHSYLFMGNGTARMRTFQAMARDAIKHGGLSNMWIGETYFLVVVDAIDLEFILKHAIEKDDTMQYLRKVTGNGSIFAPVPIWRPRRKVLAPTFTQKNLNNFVKVFSRRSAHLKDQLMTVEGQGPVSMWEYLTHYSMTAVCETALGVDLNSEWNTTGSSFLKSFEVACRLSAARIVEPWLHSDALYRLLPLHGTFEKAKDILWDFIRKIVQNKREELKQNKKHPKKETAEDMQTFLDLLIESSGGGYSDQELLEETLVIVLAGTDTSAVGASFTLCMLSRYPDVQDRVENELQEVFGDSDRPVSHEDLPRLKYLDAVVRETLRMYPPVPVTVRKSDKDLELPSGVTLPAGSSILVNIWGTHRNPRYWGDDTEMFRPERFFDAPPKHPAAFVPFSHGPRACLGYQYAMMSMKTALATVLRRYRVVSDVATSYGCRAEDKPLTVTMDVMMKDVDKFTVALERRQK